MSAEYYPVLSENSIDLATLELRRHEYSGKPPDYGGGPVGLSFTGMPPAVK